MMLPLLRLLLAAMQCDLMAVFLFQYLAIYNIENVFISISDSTKCVLKFDKYLVVTIKSAKVA